MAEDLWKLRKRRGMSVGQLAGKSGVPALSIREYESGQPIRVADLKRLARALFVDEFDIKVQSEPRRAPPPKRPPKQPAPQPVAEAPPKPAKPKKQPKPKPVVMARPTQVDHLLALGSKLGEDEEAVLARAGKPLNELTLQEVRELLHEYTERVKEFNKVQAENRPAGTRRKRAHLPEGVDEFELNYLTARQEAGDVLQFVLFSGETLTGRVVGFSPYFITITRPDETETTIHKLALAYYSQVDPSSASNNQNGQ